MFILPHLLADGLITLSRKLGIGSHSEERHTYASPSWLETYSYDDFRFLMIKLPSYQMGYRPPWMDYRMQQLAVIWKNNDGFATAWVDCE